MISGSMVALVTPMTASGDLDLPALDALIEWHIESGTNAIVSMGTTGESATLSQTEHLAVIARTVQVVGGRIPVIGGTGANATAEALELTEGAARAGVDACLLVTPYYNKPTQEGLYQHYRTVAEAVAVPQILYNVPGRTACDLKPETAARLSRIGNIVGIKEACGDVERVTALKAACVDGFALLSGEDALTLELMKRGAVGTISVTANVMPREMATFCRAFADGDLAGAEALDVQLQPLHAALFVESSPIPVKWALHMMGRIDTGIRLPLVPATGPCRAQLAECLTRLGVLGEPIAAAPGA